LLAESR